MYTSLSSLVPNVADFLELEPEEAAGVLLAHLNSYGANSHLLRVVDQLKQQSFNGSSAQI